MIDYRLQTFEQEKINISKYVDNKWKSDDLKHFHFFSANISLFLGQNYDESSHKDLYKELLSYRVLQGIDTKFYNLIDNVEDFHNSNIDTQSPSIFVSFHIGSYRAILALLIKKNTDVLLLMDPIAYASQNKAVFEQYEKIKKLFQSTSKLIILPADKKDLALDILIRTKQNYSVLAFVDGNNGFGGAFKQDHSLKINFLGKDIMVKQGLAKLSHRLSIKIVPIISRYENCAQKWDFFDPIVPSRENKAEEYSLSTMQKLYGILETSVKRYPMQWDGWLYIHKFLAEKTSSLNSLTTFTEADHQFKVSKSLGLFSLNEKYYMVNKANYKIFEISKIIFGLLKESLNKKYLNRNDIEMNDLNALFAERILLPI
ncbi:hypothetical protein FNJ88_08375 [Chryseobacterium sp. SNU WT5]|uniref:LpxL/LpxP family acyltransferase n=1 Tax=Chryseobacterium sp. SNU WT5 TaxID=2594269 RepID=UPI00118093D6|nr:hypothetical protein [Chryseobacterium sp. SNU WT5]QDP85576.1 hypothetical protein FNJ88_08375 [Chryseobacterium sp. SNU WT5]